LDPISFGQLWPLTLGVIRRHSELLVPVALAFLFLPQLVFNWHVGDTVPAELFGADRLLGDLGALSFLLLFSLIGQLVISFIAVRDGTAGLTLGQILKRSTLLLLPALAVSMMQGLAVGFGLLLFVLPGLWLLSRLVLVIPLVATDVPDPVNALKASWRMTDGHSLKILGMLAFLVLGFIMLSLGINGLGAAIGVISTVATGQPEEGWGIGRWLFESLAGLASAFIGVLYLCFIATLYRALRALPRTEG
jgi:hypothetical protein